MQKSIQFLTPALCLLLFAGAAPSADKADLTRLVVVGDSLSAGYQNGSLLATQQVHGYASLIAAQARVALPQPLIAEPGIPNALVLVSAGPPLVIQPAPGVSTGRVDPLLQPLNLAVPGHSVQQAVSLRPDLPVDSMTDVVLGLPGLVTGTVRSQVEWAEAVSPTTIICWLGNNDTLGPATEGTADRLTPASDFAAAYATVMDRLAATGAALVVATIPDVSVVPYFTPAEAVAAQAGLPLELVGPLLGIGAGDFVTPAAFDLIVKIVSGGPGPLPDYAVLNAKEVAAIRAATAAYNAVIAEQAEKHGAALVDIHALTNRIKEMGYEVGGHRLTTGFLGGMFSLDGIHPTNTGYAIIANEFIHAMNTRLAAGIPPLSVVQVFRDDPLAAATGAKPKSSLGHISREAARSVRDVFNRRGR